MQLENIELDFRGIPILLRERIKENLDSFELRGGANLPTSMLVKVPENNVGDWIKLYPMEEKENLRFGFELQSLPAEYFPNYFFGGANNPPSTLIQKMSSLNGQRAYVNQSVQIFSKPLKS